MLLELRIKDLAIIDELEVSFSPGFNVLTGETGAGKSIIIDTVSLLLGGKGGGELVRSGYEEASVEGLFQIKELSLVRAILEESGYESGDYLVIKRKVSKSGRNRFFVDGSLAPASLLLRLRELLINVCGQHEHQSLLKREKHLEILDGFGQLESLRKEYLAAYNQLKELAGKLTSLSGDREEMEKRAEGLKFQLAEIEAASLKEREEEELKEKRKLLAHGQLLSTACSEALEVLYSQKGAALEHLARAREKVARMAEIDSSLANFKVRLNAAEAEISEVALALEKYLNKLDFDLSEKERVEARLDILARIKRKYGEIAETLRYAHGIKEELAELSQTEMAVKEITRQIQEVKEQARAKAFALAQRRIRAAELFTQAIQQELASLGMDKALFGVENSVVAKAARCSNYKEFPWEEEELKSRGLDDVEFLFSSNPGEEPKPLLKTASGGELSRITLAIKRISAGMAVPSTLIFDEVDAGISGAVSEIVGRRLKELSQDCQVLCVSHLAQIARSAQSHFYVEKQEREGRSVTRVSKLTAEERVEELARMLAGLEVTPATRRHARELLKNAG